MAIFKDDVKKRQIQVIKKQLLGDIFVKLNIGNMNPVAFEPQKIEKETKVFS